MDAFASTQQVHEVEIGYSTEQLAAKLQGYQLNLKTAYSKAVVDASALNIVLSAENLEQNTYFLQLIETLSHWKPAPNAESFTSNINQLIFMWVNAIQDGSSMQSVLDVLKCFRLKPAFGLAKTDSFHLFLFDLVAETYHQHQQISMDYVLNFDANTELPNSNQIIPHLALAIKSANEQTWVGLLSLHFQASRSKLTFSKLVALELNKLIANLLKQVLPQDCQLYFTGDSQFDVLMPEITGVAQLNLLAAKITRAFEQLLFLNQQSVLVTPYIGCAYTDSNTQSSRQLYSQSKLALESATTTLEPFTTYSKTLEDTLAAQTNIESKVLEAFGSDNLTLYFQPIVNLKNGKCVGAEMLLRWSEKFGYSVYPSLTIEILNKVGKGKLFTRWLVNSACRYASELALEHKLNVYLTINLRAEDLYDAELPHLLTQATSLWKLDSKNIILEITENGILEYNEKSNTVIRQLVEQGFVFALDDFGTGFSSLSRLRDMPIDLIKIDQSFVRDITHSRNDFAIVQSIAHLAKSLGKEVLAEGVEDEACLKLIKKLEIDKCQGYFYAKPMPFEQFVEWAKAH